MTVQQSDALRSFDLINSAAQARLQERVAAAGGDIDVVRREIEDTLERLNTEVAGQADGVTADQQGDRAFYTGQITYLNLVQQAETRQEQTHNQGWWSRFRSSFRRAEAAR